MPFLFKSRGGTKRQGDRTSKEILKKLENYLNENTAEPAEFLARFWKDQENVFTYKEIRQAILDGTLTEQTIDLWRQDYSVLVSQKMNPMWQQAMKAGSSGQPHLNQSASDFSFEINKPSVRAWIKSRGADFVTAVTAEQKEAMKALLGRYADGNYTVDELSRVIRPCVGLTKSQAEANLKYYNTVKENLQKEHPRMKQESAEKKAGEAAIKYAERQHRQRAYTIAQTEMAFAYNKGMDEGIRQGQQQGLLGVMEKRWITSGDAGVCARCAALNGIQIPMDTEFDFKGKVLFAGQRLTPPAHPRCACAVQYVEIEPPVFSNQDLMLINDFANVPESDKIKDNLTEQLEKLTKEEKDALKDYTGYNAQKINSAIATGKNLDALRHSIDLLDKALDKGVITDDIMVIRKTIPEYLNVFPPGYKPTTRDILRLRGRVLKNNIYTSAALEEFEYPGRNVHIVIHIKKGYQGGLYIKKLAHEKYKGQEEILLHRGFQYRIKSVRFENGIFYLEAEV